MSKQDVTDGWSIDGQTFIHHGMGYRINRELRSVCIGPVDQDGEPLKAPTTPLETSQEDHRVVTTVSQVELVGDDVVTDKIKVLAGQGKSSRNIEKELAAAGVRISYRTIARRLQEVLI
jgi:hypothetical protein